MGALGSSSTLEQWTTTEQETVMATRIAISAHMACSFREDNQEENFIAGYCASLSAFIVSIRMDIL